LLFRLSIQPSALQLDIKGAEYLHQLASGRHVPQPDLETAADAWTG
jgi:hypothetical protein